jgi:DNA (cytosine-5)-methyltransferase 1
MNELALFAGAGGGILGGHLLGWRTVCAVEWEPYAASVLAARQNDGILPTFPIWDDVQTFDGRPWRGIVDVVSGGFPCQDISAAGKGAGISGERSGMWREMARIICEVRPKYAFIENSPMLTTRGLDVVLSDLAGMGFDARWGVLGAANVGANHQRDRAWIAAKNNVSNASKVRREWQCSIQADGCSGSVDWETMPINAKEHSPLGKVSNIRLSAKQFRKKFTWWQVEPNVGRVANGVAARVDRLKAIGNGQVPAVAATAWNLLTENL